MPGTVNEATINYLVYGLQLNCLNVRNWPEADGRAIQKNVCSILIAVTQTFYNMEDKERLKASA